MHERFEGSDAIHWNAVEPPSGGTSRSARSRPTAPAELGAHQNESKERRDDDARSSWLSCGLRLLQDDMTMTVHQLYRMRVTQLLRFLDLTSLDLVSSDVDQGIVVLRTTPCRTAGPVVRDSVDGGNRAHGAALLAAGQPEAP